MFDDFLRFFIKDADALLEQSESVLAKNEHSFAIVILTVLLALKRKKLDDENLLSLNMQICRNLYARDIDEKKMRGLSTFLNLYVHFAKPETSIKFEQEIQVLTENINTMGIEEMVLERAEKKGIKKGTENAVKNLLITNRFTIVEIANFLDVTEIFVLKVQNELK